MWLAVIVVAACIVDASASPSGHVAIEMSSREVSLEQSMVDPNDLDGLKAGGCFVDPRDRFRGWTARERMFGTRASSRCPVPNVFHTARLDTAPWSFLQFVSLLSIASVFTPRLIFIYHAAPVSAPDDDDLYMHTIQSHPALSNIVHFIPWDTNTLSDDDDVRRLAVWKYGGYSTALNFYALRPILPLLSTPHHALIGSLNPEYLQDGSSFFAAKRGSPFYDILQNDARHYRGPPAARSRYLNSGRPIQLFQRNPNSPIVHSLSPSSCRELSTTDHTQQSGQGKPKHETHTSGSHPSTGDSQEKSHINMERDGQDLCTRNPKDKKKHEIGWFIGDRLGIQQWHDHYDGDTSEASLRAAKTPLGMLVRHILDGDAFEEKMDIRKLE